MAALAIAGTLIAARILWISPFVAHQPAAAAAHAARHGRSGRRLVGGRTRRRAARRPALSHPADHRERGPRLPQRDLILVLAAAVIVISLIVQGFTLEPLVKFTGIGRPAASSRHEEIIARLRLAEAGLARLDELADGGEAPDAVIDRLRGQPGGPASGGATPGWRRARTPRAAGR